MKTSLLVLTALMVIGIPGPVGRTAQAADKNRSDDRRVSTSQLQKGGTLPKTAFPPMQDRKARAYLAQNPAKERRLDSGMKSRSDWAVTQGTNDVTKSRPESEPVVPVPGLPQGYRALNGPRARVSAWTEKPAAENPPPVSGVNLQRLVRYFQQSRPVAGGAGSTVAFRPPVKESDVSKVLEASAQGR